MVQDKRFDDYEGIILGWNIIGDDDIIEPSQDISVVPVYNRLFKSVQTNSNWGKSIIRSNIPICSNTAHYFYKKISTNNKQLIKYCNTNGKHICNISSDKLIHNNCYLNHYRTKTLKEYLDSKFNNKYSATGDIAQNSLDYYFTINKQTTEKIKYIENYIQNIHKRTLYVFLNDPSVKDLSKYRNEYKIIKGHNKDIDLLTINDDVDNVKQSFSEIVYID